jgi:hypothetical protein
MWVKCMKAPVGREHLNGKLGLLMGAPLPSTDFFFDHVSIKNASEWEFEKAPLVAVHTVAAGYVQHQDILWGQLVRCVASPGVPSYRATNYVGTLQMPTREGMVATFCSSIDNLTWHIEDWEGWKFEKVNSTTEQVTTIDGKPFDEVNHPKHYSHESGVECIDIMERLGANLGSAFKYLWRADEKHETPLVDLKKALWYLRRELAIKWEKSSVTYERLQRVLPHESYAVGSAMLAILEAACSENGSDEKETEIEKVIGFVQTEIERLSK